MQLPDEGNTRKPQVSGILKPYSWYKYEEGGAPAVNDSTVIEYSLCFHFNV